jgi:cell division septal protein FtsQ
LKIISRLTGASPYQKRSNLTLAKKSSKKTSRWPLYLSLGFLLLAILFVGSLYLAYQSNLLISHVVIVGNKTVSDFEVRQLVAQELSGKYWGLYPKRNSMLFPRDQVLAALTTSFPRLASIKLAQPNLRSLNLSMTERQGEYLWCINIDDCYFADETGFVFSPAPRFSRPLYFQFLAASSSDQVIGRSPLALADWQKLIDIQKQLNKILAGSMFANQKVWETRPAEARDWYFQVRNADNKTWDIRLDLNQNFDVATKTLNTFLVNPDFVADVNVHQAPPEYLDLRFAPKVFYRYNNKK